MILPQWCDHRPFTCLRRLRALSPPSLRAVSTRRAPSPLAVSAHRPRPLCFIPSFHFAARSQPHAMDAAAGTMTASGATVGVMTSTGATAGTTEGINHRLLSQTAQTAQRPPVRPAFLQQPKRRPDAPPVVPMSASGMFFAGEHVPPCPRLSDSELISRSNLKGDRRLPCPCRPQYQESRAMWARPRQHERSDCLQRIANQLVAERDRMRSGVPKKQRTLGNDG